MAKRRRKKPNIPQNVLDRARQNAGLEDDSPEEIAEASNGGDVSSVGERAAKRRKSNTVNLERSRQRGELTNEMIEDVLTNPTKFVSAEELQQEYQHVLVDLRNMGLLAAVLIVALVALNFFL